MRVYLAGPIFGCTDAEMSWRASATELLKERDMEAVNPLKRDYRGKEREHLRDIVEDDKREILNSDALIVMADKPSVGTSMEVLFAYDHAKYIVVVGKIGALSPWLIYHADRVVDSLEAAVALL